MQASRGQDKRLAYLESILDVSASFPDEVRYQLLHPTAAAALTAQQFHAYTAVMLIHSFSPISKWRDDFEAFCSAMGAESVSADVRRVSREPAPIYLDTNLG